MKNRRSQRSLDAEAKFLRQLAEHGATPVYEEWLGNAEHHAAVCVKGHECFPVPTRTAEGNGPCTICTGRNRAEHQARWSELLKNLGAVPLHDTWLGTNKPHPILCPAGHLAHPRPAGVFSGRGVCRACAGKDPAEAERNFLTALKQQGASPVYDCWKGSQSPHAIICCRGHKVEPRPAGVRQGQGLCRTCAGRDPADTEKNFLETLKKCGASPAYTEWKGSAANHAVVCSEGHEASPKPNNVQQGSGVCRKCFNMEWDIFYVVSDPDQTKVKFGITSRDSRRRLDTHRRDHGLSIVDFLKENFPEAHELETLVKQLLKEKGHKPLHGNEYFSYGVLPDILEIVKTLA